MTSTDTSNKLQCSTFDVQYEYLDCGKQLRNKRKGRGE